MNIDNTLVQTQNFTDGLIFNFSLVTNTVNEWITDAIKLLPNVIVALLVFVFFILIARLIKKIIVRKSTALNRPSLGNMLGGLAKWSLIVFGLLISATIVLPSLKPGDLVSGLGIGSVAIGFAFKDILQNWLAGLLILLRQPFFIGDVISVNGHVGVVESIETRATIIKTFDAQRIVVPNSEIYTSSITVKTAYPIRRSEYEVGIGYGDDITQASKVILDAVRSVKGVETDPAPDIATVDLAASWVTLRPRWWVNADASSIYQVNSDVITAIKYALDEHSIDMPFNTQIILHHDQTEETDGKRGLQREGWPKDRKNK